MSWGQDITDQLPTPAVIEQHTHHHHERRTDVVALVLIVFLALALGCMAVLSATLTLSSTVDRLLSVPMCVKETK